MTRRVVDGGFSEAWQGKRMHGKTQPSGTTQEKGPEPAGSGRAEAFPRPGPAIPCWVAPQQSPTPFRQATVILPYLSAVGRKLPLAEPSKIDTKRLPGRASKIDTKRLPGPCVENRHKAPTGSVPGGGEINPIHNRHQCYNRA
jgi:hypothetical protein